MVGINLLVDRQSCSLIKSITKDGDPIGKQNPFVNLTGKG